MQVIFIYLFIRVGKDFVLISIMAIIWISCVMNEEREREHYIVFLTATASQVLWNVRDEQNWTSCVILILLKSHIWSSTEKEWKNQLRLVKGQNGLIRRMDRE